MKLPKIKSRKKMLMIMIIVLVAVISLVSVGTYAYFTMQEEVTNTFTVGNIKIALTNDNWEEELSGKDLYPGTTIDYAPTFEITEGSAYARVIIEILDENSEAITDITKQKLIKQLTCMTTDSLITAGTPYTLNDSEAPCNRETSSTSPAIYLSWDSTNFELDKEKSTGNKVVLNYKGTTGSAPIFSHIVVPTDYTLNDVKNMGNFKIKISAEAIQTEGFASEAEAYAALDEAVNQQ